VPRAVAFLRKLAVRDVWAVAAARRRGSPLNCRSSAGRPWALGREALSYNAFRRRQARVHGRVGNRRPGL